MTMSTRSPNDARPLTDEDVRELTEWSGRTPFLELPVHSRIEHEMRVVLEGIQSSALVGRPGSGKTYAVEHIAKKVSDEEVRRALKEDREPREVKLFGAGRATGQKTVLVDLSRSLNIPIPLSGPKAVTAYQLGERIALHCQANNIHLICIDEAQLIEPGNLDSLRQIPDRAREHGHRMGLLLIGTADLLHSLKRIGQLGQRVGTVIELEGFSRTAVAANLAGFHPHISALQEALGSKGWLRLEDELFACVGLSFRRLTMVIANANLLCLHMKRRLDADVLRFAMKKLVAEE
jgi:hypothetical protein